MTSEITTAEWQALYEVAAKFREIEPWAWVNEEDIFGVRNPEPLSYDHLIAAKDLINALAECNDCNDRVN